MHDENGSPAIEPAPEAPAEINQAELDYEMTQEQEDAYVAKVLGHEAPEVKTPEEPVEPPVEPEEPAEPVTPAAPAEEPIEPEKPAEPTTIEDVKTDDLFIEFTVTGEDELGDPVEKTIKLTYDPKDPSSFIPDDLTGLTVKQISTIMDSKAEMASLYKERLSEHEEQVKSASNSKAEQDRLNTWNDEIATLRELGILDKDEKKTDSVFDYMAKTNIERAKTNLPPIVSFGTALAMYNKDSDEAKAAEAKKKENADAKTKGAMVGGGSAASTGAVEGSVYVAGSARSIHDVKVNTD